MSQSNASNSIYKKYCSVFQQDTFFPSSQEISDRYNEIKQNNESNILNSSRITSQDNKSSSVNIANLKIVLDKIVDSVTRMESSSSGIQNEKPSVIVNSNTKEFISFNHFNDDTFEDDDGHVLNGSVSETNIVDEVKAESRWGCDTQFAALVEKEATILSLVNSKDMTQDNDKPPNNENIDCAKADVIDINPKYNINTHSKENRSLKLKDVEETELVLSSTVLGDFNSPFCEATHSFDLKNEINIHNICTSEQNHRTNRCRDEVIDCAKDDTNQKNINSCRANNTSLILKNVGESKLVLSSIISSDFNSPFDEVSQTSDSQIEFDNISKNDLRNDTLNINCIPEQNHNAFLKDVTKLPSQEVLFKVPNPVLKSPGRRHRYVDTCFKDDLSNKTFKNDHVDGTFNTLQTVSCEMIYTADEASRKPKRVLENIDSDDDNTNSLEINRFKSVTNYNDGNQIISCSVMNTQDFNVKDLDLIYDQELKTLNRSCENSFPADSLKGLYFATSSEKPLTISNVISSNAKKVLEGINGAPDNMQTLDTNYSIDEQGVEANNAVEAIEDDNRFSFMETEGINDISLEDKFSQNKQLTKDNMIALNQCLNSSIAQLDDQTEHDVARTINETYTILNDPTGINNASKASTNGGDDILSDSVSTAPADNIGKISVELEHWEEFFNCTIESVNNDSEASVDFEKDKPSNCAPTITDEKNNDSDTSLSPVIVSQRSIVKIGHLAKDITKKDDTKDGRTYHFDSYGGSLETSNNIKLMAANRKSFSSARKLDLLEVNGGAKMQKNRKNNNLPGEECLDRIQEDFSPTSVLENLSKSCGGFVYASKKSVEVSDAALEKGKSIFYGVDEDDNEFLKCDNNEDSVYEGSTASCKTESVILTQRPFNVFEIEDENKIVFSKNNNPKDMNASNTVGLQDDIITALKKADDVVDDLDEDGMTMVKNIDKYIEKDNLTVFTNTDKNAKTMISDRDVFDEMISEELLEPGNNLESTAFNISSNKPITFLEKAPIKTKGHDQYEEETDNELAEQNPNRFFDGTGDNNNKYDKELMDFFDKQKSNFNDFIYVSCKPVKITQRGLDFAKNMFIDDLDGGYQGAEKNTNDPFKSYNDPAKSIVPITLEKRSTPQFPEFTSLITASNKDIPILDKVNNIRGVIKNVDIETGHIEEPTISSPKLSVLNTGNQKPTHVSKEDLAVERNGVFRDDLENGNLDEPTVLYPKFSGFSTCNQKPIHVSKEAIAFGRSVFKCEDIETRHIEEPTNSYPKLSVLNTGKQKPTHVSKEDLAVVRNGVFKDDLENGNLDEHTVSYPKFAGFSTCNQKPIHVSKEALAFGRSLFKDVDLETENFDEPTVSYPKSVFNTGNQAHTHVSKEALDVVRNEVFKFNPENVDEPTVSYPKFVGFSTCNQKPIHVSKEALAFGRSLFKGVDLETENFDEPAVSYPKSVFNTGNQAPIHVSREALDVVRNEVFEYNPENVDEPTVSYPKFAGFSTCNQKPIHVSKEALAFGRSLFKGVDLKTENFDEPAVSYPKSVFNTGNQAPIHVSKEALDVVRNEVFKYNPENVDEPTVSYPKFVGFSTCNQKPIHVSKEALAIGRKFFKDVDLEIENFVVDAKNSCEFSAGNQKEVVVQEQALSKAKMLFAEDFSRAVSSEQKTKKSVTVREDRNILSFNNNIIKEVEMVIPDKPNISKEDHASKNAIDGYTSYSVPKTHKRKRPVSPDHFNSKDYLKPDTSSNFLIENLTQEISESALALMNDEKENFSSNFEKANCSSNIHEDEAPLSPILPCRWKNKAKKTFKAPYKSQISNEDQVNSHALKRIKFTEKINVLEISNKHCFTDESVNDLKENKNIDLGDLLNSKLNRGVKKIALSSIKTVNSTVSEDVLNISPENFDNFVFSNERLDIKTSVNTKNLTVKDLVSLFYEHKDVDSKLIPNGWILNGIKWIIWKLASYERFYGEIFKNILSVSIVLTQLKYRYDKELYKTERPILRKILEMDDAPGRKMILCVSRIIKLPVVISEKTSTIGKIPPVFELEVTDGWYGVLATIDNVLCSYILKKKLQVGTKLVVCGSELINCGQGKTPLEDISAVRLRLHGNGVRRAPNSSRLGPCSDGAPLRMAVGTLEQGAGPTPILRIRSIVVYPLQHYEKLPNGSTVTRSDRMETLESSRQQSALQARAECMYAQAEDEVLREVHQERSKGRRGKRSPVDSQDSEDLAQQMEMANDPMEFLNNLSHSQRKSLETAMSERNQNIRQQIESRVSELLNGDGETSSSRRVVSMLKVRALVLETVGGRHQVTPVMLTVWKPSDSTEQMLQIKDIVLDMYKAVPTGLKAGEINLSANKSTVFKEVTNKNAVSKFTKQMEGYMRKCTSIRESNHPSFAPLFKEVDTVGLIFHIEPSVMDNPKQYVQTVYLSDQDMNFVAINFWGGIHKFGFEKCMEIGKILACCNLKFRTASRKRIRNLYASEFSTFTQCPKKAYMQEFFKEFQVGMKLNNLKEYAEKCRNFLNDMNNSLSVSNISRLQNISSTSKSGIVFDRTNNSTNGHSKIYLNENSLSGLDFDSTFAENSDVSKNPSDAERRIKRLRMYGEPPPLAALVLSVSSNIKNFIAPTIDTSLRKESCSETDTNDKEDHFREEFEYSPPLSLD